MPADAVVAGAGSCGAIDLMLRAGPQRSYAQRRLAVPPLQLSRVRYDDAADAQKAVLTLSQLGGVLEGDRYQLRVQLEAGARARLVAAAATAIHPALQHGASSQLHISLADNSCLEWLPEPLILFAGARFHQQTRIELAPGARLVFTETIVPGRLARGELFAFESYASHFEVYAGGEGTAPRLLLSERSNIEPHRQPFWKQPPFAQLPVCGSLYLLGNLPPADTLIQAIQPALPTQAGITELPNCSGLLVRILGKKPALVQQQLRHCWQVAARC